jgi:D-alanyl-D-alanine carboxypeptidase (penicillin-binding protein 5/6)
MKRIISLFFVLLTVFTCFSPISIYAEEQNVLNGEAKSVILMEAVTGKVLYEHQADLRLPPASVTKIMTILLVVEALDKGNIKPEDVVQASERASKIGGSQIYLKAGEEMTVNDLLKSVIIASANDAATALAEHVCGSVEAFVQKMNERAAELGMRSTSFENPTGLDDTVKEHLTSARDIAIMSRELLKHERIFQYTTVWMDSIRNGAFGLTNTNRLIRFYKGANGLKTGYTSGAGFCISATAERDGMQLIAVVMGSPTRDSRNETAKALLDHGFATYRYYCSPQKNVGSIRVKGGVANECPLICMELSAVAKKEIYGDGIKVEINLPDSLNAPVKAGEAVGEAIFKCGDTVIGSAKIMAGSTVKRISFGEILVRLIGSYFYK